MLKCTGSVFWRLIGGLSPRPVLRKYSGPVVTNAKTDKVDVTGSISDKNSKVESSNDKENEGLVAAAFASLNSPESQTSNEIRKPSPKSAKIGKVQHLDIQITKAADVNSLLVVAENPVVSRRHALKMVSTLSDWTNTNKVKISDFERDPRFLKLCRILARTPTSQAMSSLTMAEDLGTVLGITGDDEAARLISNLTLPQMIKVMKALSQKGRRSTPLLRALSHNIIKQAEVIDLKKSADLLFAMATLNYPEPLLLDRICDDVIQNLPGNTKPAVVNSIIVSLGLLRYRHETAISSLCSWLVEHKAARAQDLAAAVLTLATVDYVPGGCEELLKLASSLKEEDMSKSSTWLDLVFSLLILERAEEHHLVSTLQPEFIDKLLAMGEISIPTRRKLMAIDAYTQLKSLSTTRLDKDVAIGVPLVYTKEKTLYVHSILDTFKNLVSAESFLKRDCNSGMGFLYDAEFAIDAKCNPVPLEKAANDKSVYRIAVLGFDYHDMTRRTAVPLGVNKLYIRLLELQGLKVLAIPYTEFNAKDKLVTRVQYIEGRLKDILKSTATRQDKN